MDSFHFECKQICWYNTHYFKSQEYLVKNRIGIMIVSHPWAKTSDDLWE